MGDQLNILTIRARQNQERLATSIELQVHVIGKLTGMMYNYVRCSSSSYVRGCWSVPG